MQSIINNFILTILIVSILAATAIIANKAKAEDRLFCDNVVYMERQEGADHEYWFTEKYGPIFVFDFLERLPGETEEWQVCILRPEAELAEKVFKPKSLK